MKKTISAAFALLAITLALGCAETQEVAQAPVSAPEPKALPGLSPTERLRRGLALLEDGDEATARAEISIYQARTTNSSLARSLMRQIDLPPEKYFPAEYREVILRKGQSLSNIAETYLGSAIEFHALAKYNGIAQPRRMFPGQIVKVPLTSEAKEAFADLADALDEPSLASVPLAESLSDSREQAGGSDSAESAETGDSAAQPDLVPVSASATASSVAERKVEAREATEQASENAAGESAGDGRVATAAPELSDPKMREAFKGSDAGAPSAAKQLSVAQQRSVGKESSADEEPSAGEEPSANEEPSADEAPSMNEELSANAEPATVNESSAAPDVRVVALPSPIEDPAPVDVDALHRRAINAYRAQDLDTAISLWDEVLEADPGYEGARLYRSQALALRKRLNSFK